MAVQNVISTFDKLIDENVTLLKDVFNSNTKVLKILKEGQGEWEGEKTTFALETHRMGGFAFNDASGTLALPTPGVPNFASVHVPLGVAFQALEIPYVTVKRLAKSPNVLGNYLENRVKAVLKAFAMQIERSMVSNEGVFATIPAVSSATTLTLTGIYHDNVVKLFCAPGDYIDIWDGTTVTQVKITAVDPDNNQITVDPAVTTSATSYVAFPNALTVSGSNLVSQAFYTIPGIISSGNPAFRSDFEGIDADTETWWAAHVDDNGGTLRDVSLNMIDRALDSVVEDTPDETVPAFGLLNNGVKRAVIELLRTENQPTETIVSEAGWKGLKYTYNDRDIILRSDKMVPKNSIFFFSPESLKIYSAVDMEPLTVEGAASSFFDGTYPVFKKYFVYMANLGTPNRVALSVIKDLNEK